MAESSGQLGDATLERVHAETGATLTPPWQDLRPGERLVIANAPEGYDACLLAPAPLTVQRSILHICRDDARLSRLQSALSFFASDLDVRCLPAWDCLPYDRVSPNPELVARRLETLTALAQHGDTPVVLLTTVSAILQKVPPRAAFKDAMIRLTPGTTVPQTDLLQFFSRNGYRRSGTVREPGEYAVRGGIIDVFPPGAETPMRLDFFGDELETIRLFDAMSQRTVGEETAVTLVPVSEILLDDDAIRRFRDGYRAMFGVPVANDPLYEAVSSGQRHPGIEHWLPLFWDQLESVFDYMPDALVSLDHQVSAAIDARIDLIQDYYGARKEMQPANERQARAETSAVYQPVPTETLFLDLEIWRNILRQRGVAEFTPFDGAENGGKCFDAGGKPPPDFATARARPDGNPFDAVVELARVERERPIVLAAHSLGSRERLGTLLADHGVADLTPIDAWAEVAPDRPNGVYLAVLDLDNGFSAPDRLIVSEEDILGERLVRPSRRRRQAEHFITEISSLSTGDLVVHIDHGIGRYEGLEAITVGGAPHDCLRILYAGDDRLFLPVENLDMLSRYGSEEAGAQLDRLGATSWQARKARAKERIQEIADELLKTAAERTMRRGEAMQPQSGVFEEFCARFVWAETEDQQQAIDDVVADLGSGQPMDRLVCGDVGFGKTEIALRAAFVAAMGGHQVAVVVPTTLLAYQHFQTFRERFAGLPVRIEQLSRLVTPATANKVREDLANGTVDIVVGTQSLLAKSIKFQNLGLLVIDEEQHFGVAQKERLKQLKANVHVLTLTATPIPRTLQMALAGVREMSIMATPPVDRLAVRTFVLPYDPVVIREAIQRESFRGGQIFYVCPRISDLDRVHERLRELVPDAKIAVAHGRMPTRQLESVMEGFSQKRYDILLSTNIIEAGLDIPTANTMIVHRADRFGLAQLYQLRGRIGRSKVRAYAYLTLPPGQVLSEAANKRLAVMQALDTLGAGFTLASHDLDIRGAGNLLGEEQSGHIKEVGVELYQQLLEEAVARMRDGSEGPAAEDRWSPQIAIGISVLIPEAYVSDLSVRLGLYRRLAALESKGDIDAMAAEMIDRFGPLPEEVENLLQIMEIKQLCRTAHVERIEAGHKGAVVSFHDNSFPYPEGLIGFIQKEAGGVRLRPDHSLVYRGTWDRQQLRLDGVRGLVGKLAEIAQQD